MKRIEEPNIKKRTINAFLDYAILRRLKRQPMTGYRISVLLSNEFGISVSPDTVYHALYAMERKGLLRCVRNRPGRVYSLTEKGQATAESLPNKANEIQALIKALLCR